jgi:RNA polymerase sigma factor (sigma-70 family)
VAGPSFASLYAEQAPRVRRALVLSGASSHVAEDVAQEAFARTYARWRRVRAGSNPAGYVFRVAFRELRRRGHLPDDPDGDSAAETEATRDSGPEQQALAHVAAAAAMAAIEVMPPRRRACALLVLAAGLTSEEAGDALGVAPSTVRVHVHRARAQLAALPALAPAEEPAPAAVPDSQPARSPVSSAGAPVPLA